MNEDEIRKANELFEGGLISDLHYFIRVFLEKNDPYALYFYSRYSLAEWNESDEEFNLRNLDSLTKAANGGVAAAMYRLSSLYYTGENVEVDRCKGMAYLDKALALGYGFAKLTVGINLYYGVNGYPMNVKKALDLLMDAKNDNVEGAASMLEEFNIAPPHRDQTLS